MNLFEDIRNKYLSDTNLCSILKENNVQFLDGFQANKEYVLKFYQRFYPDQFPKVVLCGINPGKLGAGKTGIPFMDFNSLSQIFNDIKRKDTERSAKFIFEVIKYFGIDKFFENFYITNFSFMGFKKNSNNLNYYELPQSAVKTISEYFIYEMRIVKPMYIIALSEVVLCSINSIPNFEKVNKNRLPHPYYCSFPSHKENCLSRYINQLNEILKLISK